MRWIDQSIGGFVFLLVSSACLRLVFFYASSVVVLSVFYERGGCCRIRKIQTGGGALQALGLSVVCAVALACSVLKNKDIIGFYFWEGLFCNSGSCMGCHSGGCAVTFFVYIIGTVSVRPMLIRYPGSSAHLHRISPEARATAGFGSGVTNSVRVRVRVQVRWCRRRALCTVHTGEAGLFVSNNF